MSDKTYTFAGQIIGGPDDPELYIVDVLLPNVQRFLEGQCPVIPHTAIRSEGFSYTFWDIDFLNLVDAPYSEAYLMHTQATLQMMDTANKVVRWVLRGFDGFEAHLEKAVPEDGEELDRVKLQETIDRLQENVGKNKEAYFVCLDYWEGDDYFQGVMAFPFTRRKDHFEWHPERNKRLTLGNQEDGKTFLEFLNIFPELPIGK